MERMLRKHVPKCDFHNEDLCEKSRQIVSTYTYKYDIQPGPIEVSASENAYNFLVLEFILNQTESSFAIGLSYGHEIPELSFDLAHKRFLDPLPP